MITKSDLPALAAGILAVAGSDVGGLWLRARVGGARNAVLDGLETLVPEGPRISPEMDDVALYGGIDVAQSLSAGRRVLAEGLLARPGRVTLASAERAVGAFSARLATHLDAACAPLVAIDEGADPDEAPAPALTCRLGVFLSMDGLRPSDLTPLPSRDDVERARALYPGTTVSGELETDLVSMAALYGVAEPRLDQVARAAVKAAAALAGRRFVTADDLGVAAALVIAPRGTPPEMVSQEPPAEQSADEAEPNGETDADGSTGAMGDTVEAPQRVVLQPGLTALTGTAPRAAFGSGQGSAKASFVRGRPLPSRAGALATGRRIDPVASIRAALPWQRLRTSPPGQRLALRKSDLRIRRYENRTQRVVIFAVDASGSQAVARMAEAKGAVECLLAEAYRSRDEVALIAFRKTSADILLPPTRALVRARSALSALPGGGGTPLAAGLMAASGLAAQVKKSGATPMVVLLSDGRANVTLSGAGGRPQAQADAQMAARALGLSGIECLVLDTSRIPEQALADLARTMGGRYAALPNADARALSAVISGALDS
ncbi:MAG: VWA domain-containing protein [Pseudomonadota bacterium]